MPGAGQLLYLKTPNNRTKAIRVDTGVRENDQVSVHYDPMIAKLIVWGNDRAEALAVLRSQLSEYNVSIYTTTVEYFEFGTNVCAVCA